VKDERLDRESLGDGNIPLGCSKRAKEEGLVIVPIEKLGHYLLHLYPVNWFSPSPKAVRMRTDVLLSGRTMTLSKADADFIVNDVDKSIGEPIVWTLRQQRLQRHGFEVRVLSLSANLTDPLRLKGTANPRKWSYVLLGPKNERLRKLTTPHPGHSHPDGTIAARHHKHIWSDEDEDQWTYVPTDIRWNNPIHALEDFLAECRIVSRYDLPSFPIQLALAKE
jgi:hypothetical protein